jgi:hypothetical protein
MADVIYTFAQGERERRLLFKRVRSALYSAVLDLDEQRAEPEAIRWGARLLYDRAALERVWAACRPELRADIWCMPMALEGAGRRELLP